MDDMEYLQYCLSEVELKLGWKKAIYWKDKDFIKLAEIISRESTISISPHTLKRLYGKIKYSRRYNPQQATKDALSIYLGYNSWDDFVYSKNVLPSNQDVQEKSGFFSKKTRIRLLFMLPLVAILIFVLLHAFNPIQKNNKEVHFDFSLKDSIGTVPYTVSTNYNISKIESDSTYLDFNFNHPTLGPQFFKLNKSRYVNNFTYQIPGYYQIDLLCDGKQLSTKNVLAMSVGWNSYISYEGEIGKYWLDNEIELLNKNDSLYFSPKLIRSLGFDANSVYYITNRLFNQFKIDGDNFELETKFKNTKAIGGITCFDFILRLYFANQINAFNLMESGCSRFSSLKIGEKIIDGVNEDLSDFKIDIEDWNLFYILVKEKNAKIYINHQLIYTGSYIKPNGNLVGIENVFKGSGLLDYIKIKDLNTNQIFFDDFILKSKD